MIAKILGLLQNITKVWSGADITGKFFQTYIPDHGDGVQVRTETARRQALQLGFDSLEDMHNFLRDNKRKR